MAPIPVLYPGLKTFNIRAPEFGTGFVFVSVRIFLRVAPPSKMGQRHSGATVPEMGI